MFAESFALLSMFLIRPITPPEAFATFGSSPSAILFLAEKNERKMFPVTKSSFAKGINSNKNVYIFFKWEKTSHTRFSAEGAVYQQLKIKRIDWR